MSDLRKAAEMALEAWDNWAPSEPIDLENKIEALRQALAESANSTTDFVEPKALAQPEQEPVDWEAVAADQAMTIAMMKVEKREWIGLTDEQFLEACQLAERGNYLTALRRIQKQLKEKNT